MYDLTRVNLDVLNAELDYRHRSDASVAAPARHGLLWRRRRSAVRENR